MNRLMPHAAEKQGARASPHSILSKRVMANKTAQSAFV